VFCLRRFSRIHPREKRNIISSLDIFSIVFGGGAYNALQPERWGVPVGGVLRRLCLSLRLWIPPTAVQTCCYLLPTTWMCALRDSSIPHGPPFFLLLLLLHLFLLESAFPFPRRFLGLRLRSAERDGCCVMSVIALILPFSQRCNFFMLLPNLYGAIICILCMITFPLPAVWQSRGPMPPRVIIVGVS